MSYTIKSKTISAAIGVAMVLTSFAGVAHASSLDDQIAAARQVANQQQAQADQYTSQAQTYQERVNQLNAQIGALQAQINLNQAEYNQVTASIEANQIKLAEQKAALGSNIKSMYLSSNVTPLEMIASSKNLSEYFDQQQYQDTIKDKIQTSMAAVTLIQNKLAAQKLQVTAILDQQRAQRQQLAASQDEASQLLATAAQNADAANQQVKSTNSKIASLKAQQAAILQASSRSYTGSIPGASGGSGGACDVGYGNGGYPASWCNAPQDAPGYGGAWGYNRECVSWAGWKRAQLGRTLPTGWGNANTWDDYARSAGYRVDGSPEVGDVAQTDAGGFGHVAIVAAIQGGNVIVSEMNFDGAGHFRYGTYSISYFRYIH